MMKHPRLHGILLAATLIFQLDLYTADNPNSLMNIDNIDENAADYNLLDRFFETTSGAVRMKLKSARREGFVFEKEGRDLFLGPTQFREEERERLKEFLVEGKITDFPLPEAEKKKVYDRNGLLPLQYVRDGRTLPFAFFRPAEAGTGKSFPLILFLGGTGGIGTDNVRQIREDSSGSAVHFVSQNFQRWLPSYVLIPQSSEKSWLWHDPHWPEPRWTTGMAVQLIDVLKATRARDVDMSRLYIVGLSAGGYGVFEALAKFPEKFAAGVSLSAAGSWWRFFPCNVRPVWVFTNSGDKYGGGSMPNLSRRWKRCGMEMRWTEFKSGSHDTWTRAYEDNDFRKWLNRQKLLKVTYPSVPEDYQER